jgi:hypothetical protein
MRQLLGGTRTIRERFNREFVAFQISMIAAAPIGSLTLQSPLSCFGGEFDAITLVDGTRISSATTFGAFNDAIDRVLVGRASSDLERLTTVLALLNGNDALGACGP